MVDLESVVVRSDTILDASVDDNIVAMSVATGQYYAMKVTSRAIWARLDTPVRVDALCAALAEAYQAPLETVQADTLAFLNYLEAENMIERRER